MMNLESKKLYRTLILIAGFLLVLLINQVANRYRWIWDFTEEKRYTLHPATTTVLTNMTEPVLIEVFLSGDMPSNFKRFQNSIRETLEQFAIHAGSNIQYRFTDPSQATSTKSRNQFYKSLIDKGIKPSNITYNKGGEKTQKLVFPGAVISYNGQEVTVNLLKGNRAYSPEQMLNQSIEGLEYELINGIFQVQQSSRKRVGLILGHDEPDTTELAGLTNAVLSKYDLFRIDLPSRNSRITGYDALIVAKPTKDFTLKEKFLLDQYVMNGGNVIFFIDALSVDITKAEGEGTVAVPFELNLDDLLFKYGVRVNRNYLLDVNCGTTPVVAGMVGDQPKIEMLPWPFFPIVTNYTNHPLVKNLDATWFRFASTLDTVKAVGIKKIPLFQSSQYTKVFTPPVRVRYNDLRDELRPEAFRSGVKNLGYLLEGQFTSLFKNRFPPKGFDRNEIVEEGIPAKVIVVGDGDFIRNETDLENGNPLPMGVDPYTKNTYANEAFLLNALDYMTDEADLMLARNKEIQIRPLDRARVKEQGELWKWVNMGLPLLLVILFGVFKTIVRKKKYGKNEA